MNNRFDSAAAFTGGQRRQSGDVLLPALAPVLADSPIRLNLQEKMKPALRNVCAAAKWSAR